MGLPRIREGVREWFWANAILGISGDFSTKVPHKWTLFVRGVGVVYVDQRRVDYRT